MCDVYVALCVCAGSSTPKCRHRLQMNDLVRNVRVLPSCTDVLCTVSVSKCILRYGCRVSVVFSYEI